MSGLTPSIRIQLLSFYTFTVKIIFFFFEAQLTPPQTPNSSGNGFLSPFAVNKINWFLWENLKRILNQTTKGLVEHYEQTSTEVGCLVSDEQVNTN